MFGVETGDAELEVSGGSDPIECTQYALFSITSFVLLIFFAILLHLQCKKYGCCNKSVFKKVKTWVFVSAIIELSLLAINNFFYPYAPNYTW